MEKNIEKSIFREYDIRGIVPTQLNEQSVKLIGYYLGQRIGKGNIVAIGYDARSHSPQLRDYLTSGLNLAECRVVDMGMVATPVNYFSNFQSIDNYNISASIMITGSHNPSEYNGFKITIDKQPFFGDEIYALGDEIIQNFDKEIPNNREKIDIDVKTPYKNFMIKEFSHLKGFDKKIIIDGGNGVVDTVISDIFDILEFNYEGIYLQPDGNFPNHHPDPSVEENLIDIKKILADRGDIAFAYDGDADRIAVLTHKHNIKGDQMALLYALKIENPIVIGEVKCSQVMYDELEARGAKTIMYKTGHSNLKVKMRETNADLACEVSGHIFFKHRYFGYDDAIYATLRMLEIVAEGIDLDREIDSLPKVFSTEEIKVETTEDKKFKIIAEVKALLKNPPLNFPKIVKIIDVDGVRVHFEYGWGLIRASNTTPLLVTRFESTDKELVKLYEDKMMSLIDEAKSKIL
jgi:phosphomannomutase/phosphoglucomutase